MRKVCYMNKRKLKKQHMRRLCNKINDVVSAQKGGAVLFTTDNDYIDFSDLKPVFDEFKEYGIFATIVNTDTVDVLTFDEKAELISALKERIEENGKQTI